MLACYAGSKRCASYACSWGAYFSAGRVLYRSPGPNKVAEWASNTQGQDSQYAILQTDGNFVIYGPDLPPNAFWATGSHGSPDCVLTIMEWSPGVSIQIIDQSTNGSVWEWGTNR
jgi:hypothetical protein